MQPYGRSMFFADRASAWIGLEQDGTMVIRAGVTDLGAGQAASLANIAGEILGVTVDRTSVHIGDSHLTPLTGGTFATRQLYMSGNATVKVATALRDKLAPIACDLLGCEESELEWANNRVGVAGDRAHAVTMAELSRTAESRDVMPYSHETFSAQAGEFDPETGRGQTYPDYTHGCHAADVEVDQRTGEVKILKYVAVHDVGRAIDMQRVEGQIQGAVAQGIGYAMSEEMETEGGVLHSTLFANYLIPTSLDLPDLKAIGLELYPGKGPFGARGIGEPPIGPVRPGAGQRHPQRHRDPDAPPADDPRARAGSDAHGPRRLRARAREAGGVSAVAANGPAVALLQPRPAQSLDVVAAGRPRAFHASMPGYAPSALRPAPATAAALGVAEVLVKDESARLGLPSFKVLGASWAVYRALLARLGVTAEEVPTLAALAEAVAPLRPLSLAAATDGNHGRAVAHMAALLGLNAAIYVPANTVSARIDAIAGEGATVTVVDGGYDDAIARSAQDASERCLVISDTSWEGYEEVPAWVIEGYATVFEEIDEALGRAPGARCGGRADRRGRAGGGGGAPLLARRPALPGASGSPGSPGSSGSSGARPRIVGVEPTSAACVLESVAAGEIVTLDHPSGLDHGRPELRHAVADRVAVGVARDRRLRRRARRPRARGDAAAGRRRDRRRRDRRRRAGGHAGAHPGG